MSERKRHKWAVRIRPVAMSKLLFRWRYLTLTLTIILLMVLSPAFGPDVLGSTVAIAIFLTVAGAAMWTIANSRLALWLAGGCAAVTLLGAMPTAFRVALGPLRTPVELSYHTTAAVFLGLVIVSVLRNIVARDRVDLDTLFGGVCAYFLLGILWAAFYEAALLSLPDSFMYNGEPLVCGIDTFDLLLYFSYTTMTTVGFGDITPNNAVTRMLSNLQAITSVLYLAILMGRLVALHVGEMERDEEAEGFATGVGPALRLFHWRYAFLAVMIVLLIALSPVFGESTLGATLTVLVFLGLGAAALTSIAGSGAYFWVALAAAPLAFLGTLPDSLRVPLRVTSAPMMALCHVCGDVFLVMVMAGVLRNILRRNRITLDTVFGGVCVYLVLGLLWAALYHAALVTWPGSIMLRGREMAAGYASFERLLYFSYTTMTTVGYGDITPNNGAARMLTSLQGLTCQMYVAILIARLLALHVTGMRIAAPVPVEPPRTDLDADA